MYTLENLTTYALPHELTSVELCEAFITKCEKRAADYAALQGAPRKRVAAAAWKAKIDGAKKQLAWLKEQQPK